MAELIDDAQRALAEGKEVGPLELTEPFFGQTCFLTRAGIESIVLVQRGFAPAVDPFAERTALDPPVIAVRAPTKDVFTDEGASPARFRARTYARRRVGARHRVSASAPLRLGARRRWGAAAVLVLRMRLVAVLPIYYHLVCSACNEKATTLISETLTARASTTGRLNR